MQHPERRILCIILRSALFVGLCIGLISTAAYAQQPPSPCHPNNSANQDMTTVGTRGDIVRLPDALKNRVVQLAGRPHSQLPTQAYAEAHRQDQPLVPIPSQLFQYYLLNSTDFESNPLTAQFPGINNTAMLTATGTNCGLPTIGSVRVVLEPKPGLPTDPN